MRCVSWGWQKVPPRVSQGVKELKFCDFPFEVFWEAQVDFLASPTSNWICEHFSISPLTELHIFLLHAASPASRVLLNNAQDATRSCNRCSHSLPPLAVLIPFNCEMRRKNAEKVLRIYSNIIIIHSSFRWQKKRAEWEKWSSLRI